MSPLLGADSCFFKKLEQTELIAVTAKSPNWWLAVQKWVAGLFGLANDLEGSFPL